jgi:hypothetical protein
MGALDEKRIQICVAGREQRVIPARSGKAAGRLGPVRRHHIIGVKWIARRLGGIDEDQATRGRLRPRDLRLARSPPFDLLQLEPVPGRVADQGVEATRQAVIFSIRPDARKGNLPVEKVLFVQERPGFGL